MQICVPVNQAEVNKVPNDWTHVT